MLRINWVNYECNPYCGFWEIQFQRKNVSYFRSTIGRGRGSWIAYFFGSNHSLIVIVCNCDESFCVWLTEIIHSSNFLKSAICVRDFQGIVRDYLKTSSTFPKRLPSSIYQLLRDKLGTQSHTLLTRTWNDAPPSMHYCFTSPWGTDTVRGKEKIVCFWKN